MAISSLEDISLRKKEIQESRNGSLQTTRTLIFKHEADFGDTLIDMSALTPPSDAMANGFIQDSPTSLNLLVSKKNLKIHSSRGVWLQMYEDFLVTGANTIQLIGNIADLGGADQGEVFTIYATPVLANALITTDHKKQYQEYVLADGLSTLNLGREFEVRNAATSQLGSIRVWRNGQGPLLRNTANAAASPTADGDYYEVDSGNGIASQIQFNVPANGQNDLVVVEFGLEYAGDFSMVGDMQALYGAFAKLIADAAPAFGWPQSRYLSFNPSEVERRGFGDAVLSLVNSVQPYAGSHKIGSPQYALTVTSSNWTTERAVGIPYQTTDGAWRMRFNITGSKSAPTASWTLTIAGVTFKTLPGPVGRQAIHGNDNSGGSAPTNCFASGGASTITLNFAAIGTAITAAGDVELDGQPTFVVL